MIASHMLHLGVCVLEDGLESAARSHFVEAARWDETGIDPIVWEVSTHLPDAAEKMVANVFEKAVKRLTENQPAVWSEGQRRFHPPFSEEVLEKIRDWTEKRPGVLLGRLFGAAIAYRQDDFERCLAMCEAIVETHPDSGLGHFLKWAALERLDRKIEAFQSLQRARSVEPGFRPASENLALAFIRGGRPELAAREYARALEYEPRDVELMIGLGRALSELGGSQEEQAMDALYQALEEDPENREALLLLTRLYLRKGRQGGGPAYDELVVLADRILESRPNDSSALAMKGEALARKGDLEEAREPMRILTEINPTSVPVLASYATVEVLQGRPAAAEALLEDAAEIVAASPELEMTRAYVEMAAGKAEQAVSRLERWDGEEAAEDLLSLFEAHGRLLLGDERTALRELEAIPINGAEYRKLYESLLDATSDEDLKPIVSVLNDLQMLAERDWWNPARNRLESLEGLDDVPILLWWEALCALSLGEADEALRLCRQVTDAVPEAGRAWGIQASLHTGRREFTEAIRCHDARLGLYKNQPEIISRIHLNIGICQDALGNIEKGISEYRQALEYDPDNSVALNNLAWRQMEQGRLEQALENAGRAVRISPRQGQLQDTLGWIAYRLWERESKSGDPKAAGEHLESAVERLSRAAALSPYRPGIRYRAGLALHRAGKPNEAMEELRWALLVGEEFPEKQAAEALLSEIESE